MYVHFRCIRCKRVYGLQTTDPIRVQTPTCRSCNRPTNRSGLGAQSLRKGAIELSAATLSRQTRAAAAQNHARQHREAKLMERRHMAAAQLSPDQDYVEVEDTDDQDFLIQSSHGYNIRMRLTPGPYQARATYGHDSSCVLRVSRDIQGTAGRLNLNDVMGRHFGAAQPARYSAWRHAGTTDYSVDKFASSEWCHLVADSLGGPSEPSNLVAASFSANTYMAALEGLLKGQAALQLQVTVHCSASHIGEWIFYRILHRPTGQICDFQIDAQAGGFSANDLATQQGRLQTWLAGRGIRVQLSP